LEAEAEEDISASIGQGGAKTAKTRWWITVEKMSVGEVTHVMVNTITLSWHHN
jgi:hypothetical protein